MSLPTVSVIIPTYNGSRFIADALKSVFSQTYLPCEIIVVDDCSKDDTLAVVEGVRAESPVPLRVMQLEKNSGGPARPINHGVEKASGEVISVLEQDDVFLVEKLARQCEVFEAASDVVLVGGHAGVVHSSGEFCLACRWPEAIRGERIGQTAGWRLNGQPADLLYRRGMFLNGFPGFLFRRNAWARIGGVDEQFRITGDYDFACQVAMTGSIAMVDQVMYVHGRHDSNLSSRTDEMHVETAKVRAKLLDTVGFPNSPDARSQLGSSIADTAYLMREAKKYGPARELLHVARKLGYPASRVNRQLLMLTVHQLLSRVGLVSGRESSVTKGHVWESLAADLAKGAR